MGTADLAIFESFWGYFGPYLSKTIFVFLRPKNRDKFNCEHNTNMYYYQLVCDLVIGKEKAFILHDSMMNTALPERGKHSLA